MNSADLKDTQNRLAGNFQVLVATGFHETRRASVKGSLRKAKLLFDCFGQSAIYF